MFTKKKSCKEISCIREHHHLTSSSLIFNYLMFRKYADNSPRVHQPLYYPQLAGKVVKSRFSCENGSIQSVRPVHEHFDGV